MTQEEFEQLVAEEFPNAIPEKFRQHLKNVAFLVEDEPSAEVRKIESLEKGDTLLGYYHGIPTPMRGDWYGMGTTLPDTITLYRIPIIQEGEGDPQKIRTVICETIWHEVAHHFGMDEGQVSERERRRHKLDN